MQEELKPCPFCGEMHAVGVGKYENMFFVGCSSIKGGCGTTSGEWYSEEEAITAWNTRT